MELKRAKTSSAVVEWVHRQIFDGELRTGERIDVQNISAALGVSPTPVREALVVLERDGVVATRYHRATYVENFDAHTLRADFYVLGMLSGIASARAATHRDQAVIARLHELLADLTATRPRDVPRRTAIITEIMRTEHRAGATPRMLAELRGFGAFLSWMAGQCERRSHDEIVGAQAAVIDAITAGRSKAASQARLDDARTAGEQVIANLARRGIIEPAT